MFDAGFGDLFVIRVAGNVVSAEEAGSMEYAVNHLDTPLILVLGHEGCGAVTAALGSVEQEAPELRRLIERIHPAIADLPVDCTDAERLHHGVESNVRQSVEQIIAIATTNQPEVMADDGGPLVVGAVYELDTGRVRLLDRSVVFDGARRTGPSAGPSGRSDEPADAGQSPARRGRRR